MTKKKKEPPYPGSICFDCGKKYGNRQDAGICTVNMETCDICGEFKPTTEPRDFGHLKDGWQFHKKEQK